jgi:hypothetical protein
MRPKVSLVQLPMLVESDHVAGTILQQQPWYESDRQGTAVCAIRSHVRDVKSLDANRIRAPGTGLKVVGLRSVLVLHQGLLKAKRIHGTVYLISTYRL